MSSVPNPFKPAAPKTTKPAATTAPAAREDNMRESMKKQILKDLEVTTDSIDKIVVSNEELIKLIEEEIFNSSGKNSKDKNYRTLYMKVSTRIKGSSKAGVRQALRAALISTKDLVTLGDKEFDEKIKSEIGTEVKKATNKPPKLPANLVLQSSIDLASSTDNFKDYYDKIKENNESENKSQETSQAGPSEINQHSQNDVTDISEQLKDTTTPNTYGGLSLGGEEGHSLTNNNFVNDHREEEPVKIPDVHNITSENEPQKVDLNNITVEPEIKKSVPPPVTASKQPVKSVVKPAAKQPVRQPPTLEQQFKKQEPGQVIENNSINLDGKLHKEGIDNTEPEPSTKTISTNNNLKSNILGSLDKNLGFSPPNNPVPLNSRNNKIRQDQDHNNYKANQTIDMGDFSSKKIDSSLNQSFISSVNENQSNQKSNALQQLKRMIQSNPQKQATADDEKQSKPSNRKVSSKENNDNLHKINTNDEGQSQAAASVPYDLNSYSNININQSIAMSQSQTKENDLLKPKGNLFVSIQSNLQDRPSFKQENVDDNASILDAKTKRMIDQPQDFIIPNELQLELENLKESKVKLELELESEKRSNIIYKDEIDRLREEIQALKTTQSEVNTEAFKLEKAQLEFKLHEYQQENQQLKKQLSSYNASLEFFRSKIDQMNEQLISNQAAPQIPEFKERNIESIFNIGNNIVNNLNKPVIRIMPNPIKSHQNSLIQTQQITKATLSDVNHKEFNNKHQEPKTNYSINDDHLYDNKDIFSNRNIEQDLPRPIKMPPKQTHPHNAITSSPKIKIKDNKPKHTPFSNSNATNLFDESNAGPSIQAHQKPIKSHSEKGLNIVEPSRNDNDNIDNFTNFTNGNPNIVEEVGSENYLNMNGNTYDEAKDNQVLTADNIISQDHPLIDNDQYNNLNNKSSCNVDIAKEYSNFSDDHPRENPSASNVVSNPTVSGYKQYNTADSSMYLNADSGATTAFVSTKQENLPLKGNKPIEPKPQPKQQFNSNIFGDGVDPFDELLGSLEQQQPKDVKKQAPKPITNRPGNVNKPTIGSSSNLPKNQPIANNNKNDADFFFDSKPVNNTTTTISSHNAPKQVQPISRQAPKNDVNAGKLNMFDSGDMDHEGNFIHLKIFRKFI